MDINSVSDTTHLVLGVTFLLSILFGFAAQRSHFCTMGAISDAFTMQNWTRMRMWAIAFAIAAWGFAGLSYWGIIDPSKSLYVGSKVFWLSNLLGGFMFGFGMVLASGCASKTLLRMSAGNLKSLVVFVFMGVVAFATLKGVTAVARVHTVDLVQIEMPTPDLLSRFILSGLLGVGLLAWALKHPDMRKLSNLIPSLVIGGVVATMWWVSGRLGYVAEHPDTLQEAFMATSSGRMESLSFVAPIAYILDGFMFFSDKNKVLTIGMASVFGVLLGGFIESKLSKTFRWEGFGSMEDLGNHLTGAILMGIGGVTAMGCTVGQGLSGISTISIGSFIAVFGIFAGAIAAFKYQTWRLDQL